MLQPTTVVNKKRGEHFDLYIGRPSIWGNPFLIGRDGDRATVIRKYAAWIQTQPQLLARLGELQGKRLGCFCAPLPCHGHVLARLADAQARRTGRARDPESHGTAPPLGRTTP